MINRIIEKQIKHFLKKFPIVTLTGVRQCGKSTLLKKAFKDWEYVSLEDLDMRKFAIEDPRGFLNLYNTKTIFDEVQRVPELFSYLQTKVDNENTMGQYILSGSHNFRLMESISQSLAGRVAVLTLAPFSIGELSESKLISKNKDEIMLKGFYPAIFDRDLSPNEYFPSYIDTYIERDVRIIQNISNMSNFLKFINLLAARSGQIINYTELSNKSDLSVPTVKSYLSILIQSYIIFELPPYYNNISKRLVKSPKIYFYDTGLLCYMLGIKNIKELKTSDLYGSIFETMIMAEFMKQNYFNAMKPNATFYRDSNQSEIDLLYEINNSLKAFEIKASESIDLNYFKNIKKLSSTLDISKENINCIYGGDKNFVTEKGNFISYLSSEYL